MDLCFQTLKCSREILEKIFEYFFQQKNFANINFLYTFSPRNGTTDKKTAERWQWLNIQSHIENILLFVVTFKTSHINVTNSRRVRRDWIALGFPVVRR